MSCSTAASAPSMLMGSGLTTAAMARSMRLDERDAVAGDAPAARHLEQDRGSRIGRVDAMAEAREPPAAARASVDEAARRFVQRDRLGLRARHALGNHLHAAGAGAAVVVADGENARGDRRRQRLAVAR